MFITLRLDAHNPGPMTGTGNHTYLLCAGGDAVLIDAGVGDARHLEALAIHLKKFDAQLRAVLVTHAHGDHASGAAAIGAVYPSARFFKCRWPERDANFAVTWGPLADGDRFSVGADELVVLHTPGHAPDHVAFWHPPGGAMFTGDLVTAGSSVMIEASRGGRLSDYLESLERIRALKPTRLLPAHGPEILDPDAVLRGYRAHRLMREQQVIDALAAGHRDVPAIAESIYDGLSPALMPAARENVRAHLDKLIQEGRAVEEDGRWRLAPT